MAKACLDTQILIWGTKKQFSPGQEEKVKTASRFLEHLVENRTTVIVPVPVITELLAPVDPKEFPALLELIHKRFRVVPVDEIAAIECAKIWHSKKDDVELRKYRKGEKITREAMKFDFQIAAVAITRGCDCIYSEDPHIRRFVGNIIDVRDVPKTNHQSGQVDLFNDTDDQE